MLVVLHTISALLCLHCTHATKILLIGSSNSFKSNEEPPFKLDEISEHLTDFGVDVVVEDVHTSTNLDILAGSGSSVWEDMPHYLFSLAQYMFWPDGKAQRDNLLQGNSSEGQWDYVVLLHDPYILSRMPGYFAEGVNMVSKEIKVGGATPLLFMQWPGPSSSANLNSFVDIAYRVGAGAGVRVIPGAEAWQSFGSDPFSGLEAWERPAHPTPHGALIAAAAIYAEISGTSAANKLSDAVDQYTANDVFDLVDQERCQNHVSGAFTLATPFSMSDSSRTGQIKMCHTGSSSERGITGGLHRVAATYDGASVSQQGCSVDGLDFNLGRGNTNFEANKQYKVGNYPFSFGFPMQERRDGSIITFPYGLDHRRWQANDLDICQNMIEKDEVSLGARCVPLRLMYNKMKKEDSDVRTHRDNWHMSTELDNAAGAYIYTIVSRQPCQQGGEPSEKYTDAWRLWLGFRIGCETAWRLATLTDDSGSDLSPTCVGSTAAPTTAAPTTAAPTTAAPTTAAPTTAAPTTAAPTTAAPTTAAPTTAAPTGGSCEDWPDWIEGHMKTCSWWAENPEYRCRFYNGTAGYVPQPNFGQTLEEEDGPENACCACGGGTQGQPASTTTTTTPLATQACEDWPDWIEGHMKTCSWWAENPEYRCRFYNGTAGYVPQPNFGQTLEEEDGPENACCACGGGTQAQLDLVSMPIKKHNDDRAQMQVSSDGSIHHTKFAQHVKNMHGEEPEPTTSGD